MASRTIKGAELLRAWLDEPGAERSQSWLARTIGVGQPAVSSWCRAVFVPEPAHQRAIEILAGADEHGAPRIPKDVWLTDDERAQIDRIEALAQHTGTEG